LHEENGLAISSEKVMDELRLSPNHGRRMLSLTPSMMNETLSQTVERAPHPIAPQGASV
jgi:hypothetical protein